jgi:hypothetical protein
MKNKIFEDKKKTFKFSPVGHSRDGVFPSEAGALIRAVGLPELDLVSNFKSPILVSEALRPKHFSASS